MRTSKLGVLDLLAAGCAVADRPREKSLRSEDLSGHDSDFLESATPSTQQAYKPLSKTLPSPRQSSPTGISIRRQICFLRSERRLNSLKPTSATSKSALWNYKQGYRDNSELPLYLFTYSVSVTVSSKTIYFYPYMVKTAQEHLQLAHSLGNMFERSAESELALAIYEVGQCFFHGWGVIKDQKMGASCYTVAARLADADAQNDLAFCLANGKRCKKDKKEVARWYRAAVAQGQSDIGLAWIYKEKYQ